MRRTMPLFAVVLVLAGCYRATVETGLRPSGDEIRNDWAHSFIAGLVPPSTVETAARCPDGVAQVQTQLSFLNMVANVVTLGIYSPMSILVRCAAAGGGADAAAFVVPAGSTLEHSTRIFNAALAEAASLQEPVRVRFD